MQRKTTFHNGILQWHLTMAFEDANIARAHFPILICHHNMAFFK
jgi:hypothetical protein